MNKKARTKENNSPNRPRKSLKNTRVIEIGWLCTSEGDNVFRQVKTKAGGGTRKVNIPKNVLCTEVLEKAKNLFFPNGVSTKGHLDDFEVKLLDYKSHECNLDLTIQQMYELSALTVLRFYMGTIYKKEPVHVDEETFIPQTVTRPPSSPENNVEPVQASPTEHLRRSERLNQTTTTRYFQDFEGKPINIYSPPSLRRSERLHPPREITNYFENFSEDNIFDMEVIEGVELQSTKRDN
ncbi:uncharacterized protein [Leptinotarsa decemlineata]|uniref:uncharacterized protein n=1 Tax=Leptinotarsa decemlineata TaxID=7539 RepID=UPI003D30A534